MHVEYWHWLVLGMGLLIAEVFVPSFTICWFGLGALLVAFLVFLFAGLSINVQIFLWAIFSIAMTFLWFRFLKPRMGDKTKAAMSREAIIGEVGLVIRIPQTNQRGMLRFSKPLLGADEWLFLCEESVEVGDRVQVQEVSGNTLIVTPKTLL